MAKATKKPTPLETFGNDWRRWYGIQEQALATVSTDTTAVVDAITAVARHFDTPIITWDAAAGFTSEQIPEELAEQVQLLGNECQDDGLLGPAHAFQAVTKFKLPYVETPSGRQQNAIFLFMNFFPFFNDEEVRQVFETNCRTYNLSNDQPRYDPVTHEQISTGQMRPIHLVQAPYNKTLTYGVEAVEHMIRMLPLGLPSEEEIYDVYVSAAVVNCQKHKQSLIDTNSDYSEENLRSLAAACRGLARHEITSILLCEIQRADGLTSALPSIVSRVVANTLAATGTMEVIPDHVIAPPEQLGGVDAVLSRLERAANTYTSAAKAQHLDPATGLWLCGTEGTGKTEIAKTAGIVFSRKTKRPWRVIKVNLSSFYGGLVGDTEKNWMKFEEKTHPFDNIIFFFDEYDKMFGGVSGRNGDSGVSQSLFGLWLGWMNDRYRRGDSYVIIAMNDPSGIPPEALRAGRFDAGFFFGLPGHEARIAIAKIHLAKRVAKMDIRLADLEFTADDWEKIGTRTTGYKPAEIEGVIKDARTHAFETRGLAVPTATDVLFIIDTIKEETQRQPEIRQAEEARKAKLDELKKKCLAMKARPVSTAPDKPPAPPTKKMSPIPKRGMVTTKTPLAKPDCDQEEDE